MLVLLPHSRRECGGRGRGISLIWTGKRGARGHAGARTQDLRLIRATLYRLSYTTPPGRQYDHIDRDLHDPIGPHVDRDSHDRWSWLHDRIGRGLHDRIGRASAALSVAQLVEHVTVDVCDHRVAGSIPAAERRVFVEPRRGGVAQMVERSLSMREVQGSIPCISNAFWHDGHPWSSWL